MACVAIEDLNLFCFFSQSDLRVHMSVCVCLCDEFMIANMQSAPRFFCRWRNRRRHQRQRHHGNCNLAAAYVSVYACVCERVVFRMRADLGMRAHHRPRPVARDVPSARAHAKDRARVGESQVRDHEAQQ